MPLRTPFTEPQQKLHSVMLFLSKYIMDNSNFVLIHTKAFLHLILILPSLTFKIKRKPIKGGEKTLPDDNTWVMFLSSH